MRLARGSLRFATSRDSEGNSGQPPLKDDVVVIVETAQGEKIESPRMPGVMADQDRHRIQMRKNKDRQLPDAVRELTEEDDSEGG